MTGMKDSITNLIRRFFAWFWGKVLHRTGYKALVNGEIIDGCGVCGFNKEMRLHTLPAHYCIESIKSNGEPQAIYDPFDIPEFCPNRVTIPEMDK